MHRIDGTGATGSNLFTEGDPATAVAATVVTDDWLNDVQEEIANAIEDAGITLVKGTQTQLRDAIRAEIENLASSQAIGNNQTDQDLTDLLYDGSPASGLGVKSVRIDYDIHRKDDSQEKTANGQLTLLFYPGGDSWEMVGPDEIGDDCGLSFTLSDAGGIAQLQYSTTNYAGANYEGTIRFKIKKFTYSV